MKLTEIREDAAERIWGLLYTIKGQIANYMKGKCTQEEVRQKNQKSLKKILQVRKTHEGLIKQVMV